MGKSGASPWQRTPAEPVIGLFPMTGIEKTHIFRQ
jgi:hypothetical protein